MPLQDNNRKKGAQPNVRKGNHPIGPRQEKPFPLGLPYIHRNTGARGEKNLRGTEYATIFPSKRESAITKSSPNEYTN